MFMVSCTIDLIVGILMKKIAVYLKNKIVKNASDLANSVPDLKTSLKI